MQDHARQNPRTALLSQSIWHDVPETQFRKLVVALEQCTNAVPIDPKQFAFECAASHVNNAQPQPHLPLDVEQDLANDIACLVAVEEGAQSVAAVCLEEHVDGRGLTVRVAAVDAINSAVQQMLLQIFQSLATGCDDAIRDETDESQRLFELILSQHKARILGRLRSSKWEKPKHLSRSHKKPLWQDFANVIHRVQFLFAKKERGLRDEIESALRNMATVYEAFENVNVNSAGEVASLQHLIKSSYDFCISKAARVYAQRLNELTHATEQAKSAIKSLQQVEKVAAYWRIPTRLVEWSHRYPLLFRNLSLAYIIPYAPIATEIGYESWATTCHVHAEVQLAVFYDLRHQGWESISPDTVPESHSPRCIGTSKHLCYLCFLFLTHRNTASCASFNTGLHVANTHGRLYDQWTIPDLAEFHLNTLGLYRSIVSTMSAEIRGLTSDIVTELEQEQLRLGDGRGNGKQRNSEGKLVKWRVEPMTSRQDLLLVNGQL